MEDYCERGNACVTEIFDKFERRHSEINSQKTSINYGEQTMKLLNEKRNMANTFVDGFNEGILKFNTFYIKNAKSVYSTFN